MPRIENKIIINAEPSTVYQITNDIDKWCELFEDYKVSKVISKEDSGRFSEIFFQLGYEENKLWTSWRMMDNEKLVAIAERVDPLYPFLFMHLKWTYEAVEEGTLMTWRQDFEMDPGFQDNIADVLERMNKHTAINQNKIKKTIESKLLSYN